MSTASVDFRNLVYKLCERREVPLLVTDIIAGYLVPRDLFNISVLSRSLNSQANAIIYRDVVLNLDGSEQSTKKASLLSRTLLTSETATHAVRTVSLTGDPLQDWRNRFSRVGDSESIEAPLRGRTPPGMHTDLTSFTQEEITLYNNTAVSSSTNIRLPASEIPVWALYLQILRLAPHVQGVSIGSDFFRFPDFRSTLEDLARDSSLEKLRSCSLCLDLLHGKRRHASVVQDWDSVLLMLFAIPGIQTITAVVSLKPEAVHQLKPGATSITRLDLCHYQILDFDLNSLLAATPSLKYLKYHARTDYAWLTAPHRKKNTPERGLGLQPLYGALHHVSDSLEELHTSHDFDEDSIHYPGYAVGYDPPFRQTEELSTLKRLHTLTIPYATLLGWRRNDFVWDWDMVLPSSVRHVILTDDLQENCFAERWTDKHLMPVISSLVKWLSATQPGTKATDFGLHVAKLDTEFNEPVRQELTRICEEHGVKISIEKVHADRYVASRPHLPRGRGRGNLTGGRARGRGA